MSGQDGNRYGKCAMPVGYWLKIRAPIGQTGPATRRAANGGDRIQRRDRLGNAGGLNWWRSRDSPGIRGCPLPCSFNGV